MPSRMPLIFQAVGLLLLIAAGSAAQAAGDAGRGQKLAYTCLGCHGIESYKNVYPTYNVPRLVGQHPEYIVAALKAYKNQERSHGTMHAQAVSLSDQDMEDLGVYFAGTVLKAGAPTVGVAPAKVSELCVACHGKDGVGIIADYPSLGGQHADYLEQALQEYKRGDRKNPVMSTFVATLSENDFSTIAEYYSRQSPSLGTVKRRVWFMAPK